MDFVKVVTDLNCDFSEFASDDDSELLQYSTTGFVDVITMYMTKTGGEVLLYCSEEDSCIETDERLKSHLYGRIAEIYNRMNSWMLFFEWTALSE